MYFKVIHYLILYQNNFYNIILIPKNLKMFYLNS